MGENQRFLVLLDKDGGMLSATTFKGYLFNQSGAMAESNWVKIKDTWFYANGSGDISETTGKRFRVPGTHLTRMGEC